MVQRIRSTMKEEKYQHSPCVCKETIPDARGLLGLEVKYVAKCNHLKLSLDKCCLTSVRYMFSYSLLLG